MHCRDSDADTRDNSNYSSRIVPTDGHEAGENPHDDDESPVFEEVLKKVGTTGKFQIIQCVLCMFPVMSITFGGLGFVFTGYTPPHVCKEVNETELMTSYDLLNDSTAHISYGQCDITLSSNQTGSWRMVATLSCPNGRRFPEGKYMTMVSEWDLVCEKTGLPEMAALVASIGGIIGGLLVPGFADRFGRKPILCLAAITAVMADISMAFSPSIYYVFFGYFVVGMMIAALDATYLVLGMEILAPRHRPVYGVIICQFWVFCVLLIGFLAYTLNDVGWRYLQGTCALVGLISFAMPFLLYESPRWLTTKGRSEEALTILENASQKNGKDFTEVKKTFEAYMMSVRRSKPHKRIATENGEQCEILVAGKGEKPSLTRNVSIIAMILNRDSIILLLIIWYMWTTCNVTYFGVYMSSSDLAGNRFLSYTLMALAEIPSNFTIQVMMKRMGRLQVMRVFIGLAAASFLVSLSLTFLKDEIEHFEIVSTLLFIVGKFAVTCFFNVIYIYTPEIFPTVIRSAGSGSCRSISAIGLMLAPYTRPLYSIAEWGPALIFSSVCFIALLLSFRLPETKDRTLPTDLSDFGRRKKQRQSGMTKSLNKV